MSDPSARQFPFKFAAVFAIVVASVALWNHGSSGLDVDQRRQLYFEFCEADESLWLPVDQAVADADLMRSSPERWQAKIDEASDQADKLQAELELRVAAKYGIPADQAESYIRDVMLEGAERGWIKQLSIKQ